MKAWILPLLLLSAASLTVLYFLHGTSDHQQHLKNRALDDKFVGKHVLKLYEFDGLTDDQLRIRIQEKVSHAINSRDLYRGRIPRGGVSVILFATEAEFNQFNNDLGQNVADNSGVRPNTALVDSTYPYEVAHSGATRNADGTLNVNVQSMERVYLRLGRYTNNDERIYHFDRIYQNRPPNTRPVDETIIRRRHDDDPSNAGGSDHDSSDAGGSDHNPSDAGGSDHNPSDAGGSDHNPPDSGGSDRDASHDKSDADNSDDEFHSAVEGDDDDDDDEFHSAVERDDDNDSEGTDDERKGRPPPRCKKPPKRRKGRRNRRRGRGGNQECRGPQPWSMGGVMARVRAGLGHVASAPGRMYRWLRG